jgi:hypothetical protein
MKKNIKFTKDFGSVKTGKQMFIDGILANELVNVKKVAEYVTEPVKDSKDTSEKPKQTKKK